MALNNILGAVATAAGNTVLGHAKDKEEALTRALRERQETRQRTQDALLERKTGADIEESLARAFSLRNPRQEIGPLEVVVGSDGKRTYQPRAAAVGQAAPEPVAPSQYTFPVGQDGEGKPVVLRGNNRTGEIEPTNVAAPARAGGGLSGAALRTAIANNRTQIASIDAAIAELDANPEAVGLKRGLTAVPGMAKIGEIANQKMDPDGISARNKLGNVSSVVIQDRSGAAVSGKEWERLGFVPDQAYDYDANRKKLLDMKAFAELKTREMEDAAGGSAAASTANKPGASSREQELWDAAVRVHGRAKVEAEYGPRP